MEPNLPKIHRTQNFRNEREYNEWRRAAYPRHLMPRQNEGWLRRVLRAIRDSSQPGPAISRSETESTACGCVPKSSPQV